MKFYCSKDELQKALSMTESAASDRLGMQILSNVFIEAKSDKIIIIGTDTEITIKSELIAKVEKEGVSTISAKKINDILKTFPSGDVLIESDDKFNITVTSTNIDAKFRLQGKDPEEFPKIEKSDDKYFSIPQHLLRDMIRKTIYATSKDSLRHFLQGVFFEKKGSSELRLVATDGQRLSLTKYEIESLKNFDDFGVIIPQKPLNELLKVLENDGECNIIFTEKMGFFKLASVEISSITIDTQFLDYRSVIPKNLKYELTANTEHLSNSIKRVSSILDVKERKIKFEIRKNYINIYGDNPNLGDAVEKVEVQYSGADIDIGLNYEFMLQSLKEIKSESVVISIESGFQPIIVKEAGSEDSLVVIGPMRLM